VKGRPRSLSSIRTTRQSWRVRRAAPEHRSGADASRGSRDARQRCDTMVSAVGLPASRAWLTGISAFLRRQAATCQVRNHSPCAGLSVADAVTCFARRRTFEAPSGERAQNRHDAFGVVPVRRRDIDRRRDAAFVDRNMDFDAPDLLPALRPRNRRHRQMRPHGPGDVFAGRTAVPMFWPRCYRTRRRSGWTFAFPDTAHNSTDRCDRSRADWLELSTNSFLRSSSRSQKLSDAGVRRRCSSG
jgi:hypothetical protein